MVNRRRVKKHEPVPLQLENLHLPLLLHQLQGKPPLLRHLGYKFRLHRSNHGQRHRHSLDKGRRFHHSLEEGHHISDKIRHPIGEDHGHHKVLSQDKFVSVRTSNDWYKVSKSLVSKFQSSHFSISSINIS